MSGQPHDHETRVRLRTELDRTFFVAAGAGSGKTSTLVARIVELIAAGRVEINRLAAITFTDAAAAELRDRVRHGLERAAQGKDDSGKERTPDERERCQRAAAEIDTAAIQTIHAFAGSLLRTYPLEAELPPGFATLNQLQQEQLFLDRFRSWLYDEIPDPSTPEQARTAVRRALALGMTPDLLRELAQKLQEHADLLTPATQWRRPAPPDALDAAQEIGMSLLDLQAYIPYAKNGEQDKLVQNIQRVQFPARRLLQARTEDEALIALQFFLQRRPSVKDGSQKDWDDGPNGNPVKAIKAAFRSAIDLATETLDKHRQAVLVDVLHLLRDLLLAFERERKQQGVATFHDLLKWARDLLRDNPEVRRSASQWYQRVFVDEFQDTDPLQAEIVWFLCGDARYADRRDWRDVRLIPGKLFLVGDPKQSIYRFRRADIALYEQVYQRIDADGALVSLTQNFRSVEHILAWVNHHFAQHMQEQPGIQPRYEPLAPRSVALGEPAVDPRVGTYRVGHLLPEGTRAPERWKREALAVARICRWLAGRWPLSDASSPRGWRPLRYDDICVLLPSRANLRRLERAFEDEGVPYRMESGSLILQTQEVRDLLACLRAIDDPSDQVALVAALRSPAYACSDVDLLRWVESGGRLDYEAAGTGEPGPVAEALRSLRSFHQRRASYSPAALIEQFLHERMLTLHVFGLRRPRESWRRLRYVVEQARRVAASGQVSLRSVLDYLEQRRTSTSYDVDSPAPESDENAVRFMTVHGAKGLEFPAVILTGLGHDKKKQERVYVLVNHLDSTIAVRCGGRKKKSGDGWEGAFMTDDYPAAFAREEHALEAEQVRLLYVAGTRAREYLFLSLYHEKKGCAAATILEYLEGTGDDICRDFVLPPDDALVDAATEPVASDDSNDDLLEEDAWLKQRKGLLAQLTAEPRVTPSTLARTSENATGAAVPASMESDEDEPEPGPPETAPTEAPIRTGRGGSELGRAVHAVLQLADLATLADLEQIADTVLPQYQTTASPAEVARLAAAAARSEPVRRAIASGRYWREVPVGVELDGKILEGVIDLLYQHEDGTLGIVDYKTDHITPEEVEARAEHHAIQGGAYALAVERATGMPVSSFEVVFAALDGRTVGYFGDALRARIERSRSLMAVS